MLRDRGKKNRDVFFGRYDIGVLTAGMKLIQNISGIDRYVFGQLAIWLTQIRVIAPPPPQCALLALELSFLCIMLDTRAK